MTGPTPKTRLSPPLMYAFREAHAARDARKSLDLRDESGERVIAGRRASPRSTITEPLLRREVAGDLTRLMNSINMAASTDLGGQDWVRRSILNHGFPSISHRSLDDVTVDEIGQEIETVLRHYEPRVAPGSVEVARDRAAQVDVFTVRFTVRADLLCTPVNVPVEFVADLKVDTGKIVIDRL